MGARTVQQPPVREKTTTLSGVDPRMLKGRSAAKSSDVPPQNKLGKGRCQGEQQNLNEQ